MFRSYRTIITRLKYYNVSAYVIGLIVTTDPLQTSVLHNLFREHDILKYCDGLGDTSELNVAT
jgi:hypothetical protein